MPAVSWREYVRLRYPSRAAELERVKLPLTVAEAASEGLAFANYAERPLSVTQPSYCLLKAGFDADCTLQTVEALFRAHFVDGRDLSDTAVLLGVAAEVGISEAAAREALRDGSAARAWVDAEDRRARTELRVSAVPHYVLTAASGRSTSLTGAVQPEAWLRAFASLS